MAVPTIPTDRDHGPTMVQASIIIRQDLMALDPPDTFTRQDRMEVGRLRTAGASSLPKFQI